MNRLDFLLPFVGIIIGLGVADLLLSVHRTVRAGKRWSMLPAVWAALTFFFVLMYWWVLAEIITDENIGTFFGFAFHLGSPVLLFLTCAAALPDSGDDQPLADYYVENRRYFFGLLTAYFVHAALDYGFNYGSWGQVPPWIALALAVLAGSLALTGRRAVHVAVTGLITAALLATLVVFTASF